MAPENTLSSTNRVVATLTTTVKVLMGVAVMIGLMLQTTGSDVSRPTASTALKNYSVWSTSPFKKVFKNNPTMALETYTVRAAKNEHEPFQIVLRTGSTAVNGIRLAANDLRLGTRGFIPARNVKLYLERYIYLPTLGMDYADPLPPHQAPFNMATGQTQPVWVDIFVPKGVPAGDYSSTITITDASGAKTEVPYVLHVYNFTLPDDWKHATSFGIRWDNIADKHGVARGSTRHIALMKKYWWFMLDHGISVYKLPVSILSSEADVYLKDPRLTSFEIPYYLNRVQQRAVLNKVKTLRVLNKGYYYPWDEPDSKDEYDRIILKSKYIRGMDPNTRIICVFTANPSWRSGTAIDALENYCNIWCPKTSWMVSSVVSDLNRVRSKRHTTWSYYCLGVPRDRWAQIYLDSASVAYPMVMWQNYNANVTGFLYWDGIYWEEISDPWASMQTAISVEPKIYGEGSLVYPGSKVGIDGPVSSIRLELFRGGLEDYQYFWLLEQKMGRSGVLPYIRKVTTSYTSWSRDYNLFQTTKDEIARMIE